MKMLQKISQMFLFMLCIGINVTLLSGPADAWVRGLQVKYPSVNFKNIQIISSNSPRWSVWTNRSGYTFIGCPADKFNGSKPFSVADEVSFLHEVGHRENHATLPWLWNQGKPTITIAALVALGCFMGSGGHDKITQQCDVAKDSYVGLGLSALTIAGLSWMIKKAATPFSKRIDEALADSYACSQASFLALKEKYYDFSRHAQLQNKNYKTFLHRWLHDFAHPASADRAEKIRIAALQRFGVDFAQ